jgi:hypothetical protein
LGDTFSRSATLSPSSDSIEVIMDSSSNTNRDMFSNIFLT